MMSKNSMLLSLTLPILALSSCGKERIVPRSTPASHVKEAWNGDNNPYNIERYFERRFYSLPASAELSNKPWSDSYWPNNVGGIAYRWNDPAHTSVFNYQPYDRNAVFAMNWEQRKKLSPAEKYDILQGRFDYPTVAAERQRTHAWDASWNGLCHGLAPASMNFQEPKAINVQGAGGIWMPLGSSDIKALLIYSHAMNHKGYFVGRRCWADLRTNPERANDPECRGVNAGSFHLVMANFIGRMGRTFVTDFARAGEVWNHPPFAYSSQVNWESNQVYPGAAPGTVKVLGVRTFIRYIGATYANWNPMPFWNYRGQEQSKTYDYLLELNSAGEIIGGEWKSYDRPGFLWLQSGDGLYGYLADVRRIYDQSIR